MRASVGPGEVLAGKYLVERILGEGGQGFILGARHTALGERVAIKLLRPEHTMKLDVVSRFFREARASVRVKSDHVVRVLDVGTTGDGSPFIVMEYLDGVDLAALIAGRGPLPVAVAVDYVLQACDAIAEAHGLGIVHRDIKPSNLFLTTDRGGGPCIKVLDFGISKALTDGEVDLTQTQTVLGSPQYMAPEQMRSSRRVDARTDVWALGVTLHELLTGRAPFESPAMAELCAMILQDDPPKMAAVRPDVPPALEAVVACCLQKDPANRFASVRDLALALAPMASPAQAALVEQIPVMPSSVRTIVDAGGDGMPSSVRVLVDDGASDRNLALARTDDPARERMRGRSRRAAVVLVAAVALVGGGSALYLARQRAQASDVRAEAPPAVVESAAAPVASREAAPASSALQTLDTDAGEKRASPSRVRPPPAPRPAASGRPRPGPATRPSGVASSRYD
jgi:serine/threonine-protein kinase